jgi:hypothetical protein
MVIGRAWEPDLLEGPAHTVLGRALYPAALG